jgi:hypothetical protein
MGQKETAMNGKNRIMIYGPKADSTYIVELKTAAGEALPWAIALVRDRRHGRAGDELAQLVLALAAERAMERVLGLAAVEFAHLRPWVRCESSRSLPRRPNEAHTRSRRPTYARRG